MKQCYNACLTTLGPIRPSSGTPQDKGVFTSKTAIWPPGQAWKFCIFWERRSEPKKIQEPKKTKKKEMKRGERERKEKRGERE